MGANLVDIIRNTALYDRKKFGLENFFSPLGVGDLWVPVSWTLLVGTPWFSFSFLEDLELWKLCSDLSQDLYIAYMTSNKVVGI